VLSVQLARSVHEAVLLVNGRSAVRSRSPAPSSAGSLHSSWRSRWSVGRPLSSRDWTDANPAPWPRA